MAAKRRSLYFNVRRLMLFGVSMGCGALPVIAGDWVITPTIAVNETSTDNVALSSVNKQRDLITDLNPGIRIEGSGGRSKLRFDYQVHELIYAKDSAHNGRQNSLNTLGTLEALENWLFIEASGIVSQQNISAFSGATATTVNANVNNNSTETSTYRLSPYIRGVLGGFADYQLRYNLSNTSTKSTQAFNSDTRELVATLKGATGLANLGWSLDASSMRINYSNVRSNEVDRLRGVLTYQFDPQYKVSLIGGKEANNYQSLSKESHPTKGVGIDWSPTDRTQMSASREDRFFGKSNSFSFTHRTSGSAWKYSESKDASALPIQQQSVGLGSYFDLAFVLCKSAAPPGTTDAQLTACANAMLGGISPAAQLQGGFLSSGVTLQQRREMSFALIGARNTVTFAATQSESQSLSQGVGTGLLVGSDFANAQNIRQRGASINWSHKLTPLSSLTGTFSRLNSTGSGGSSSIETTQQMINVNLLTQLGPKTNAGFGARRVVFDGTTNYAEHALTALLSHQF
jgi:uncharacterized protein (PEP-CTERM system associated)